MYLNNFNVNPLFLLGMIKFNTQYLNLLFYNNIVFACPFAYKRYVRNKTYL